MTFAPSPHPIPEDKSTWLKWLMTFVEGQMPEDSTLDYKAGDALNKLSCNWLKENIPQGERKRLSDKAKADLTSDVSGFANAAGGLLIYGILEDDSQPQSVPKGFAPVSRRHLNTDQIEQILNGILPTIEACRIRVVDLPSDQDGCCVLIEVPQSATAHQAKDGLYYRRRLSETTYMLDYEIRETMNRAKHPQLDCEVLGNFHLSDLSGATYVQEVHISVHNPSLICCQNFCCLVVLPKVLVGKMVCTALGEPVTAVKTAQGHGLKFEFEGSNLYPGMSRQRKYSFTLKPTSSPYDLVDVLENEFLIQIFADSAPKKQKRFTIEEILQKSRRGLIPSLL